MENGELISLWKQEEDRPFRGWDFNPIRGRYSEPSPPWSYEDMVRSLLDHARSVLDMGTGGGEKLMEFQDALPQSTMATEGWPPNLPLARENLKPIGVEVRAYDAELNDRMPFSDRSFSLIINRHEAFVAQELTRILESGGVFLTQQVSGPVFEDLADLFHWQPPHPEVTLADCQKALETAGLTVDLAEEATGELRFEDIGAFVYFAHAAPWEVPDDFSVDRYADELLFMHKSHKLSFAMGHFILRARKP